MSGGLPVPYVNQQMLLDLLRAYFVQIWASHTATRYDNGKLVLQNKENEVCQVEDQITPKKCGHLEGKQLISEDEMIRKIKAFNYARGSTDFLLIARTDALAVYGLNDAIERAKSYREAGADIIFVESPRNKKDLEKISVQLSGIILMVNLVEGGGKTPILPLKELRDMGYRIVIYPITPLLASIKSIQRNLAVLKAHGNTSVEKLNMSTLTEMFDLVGMQFYKSLDNYF
jgi:2-methylisocitrate lyase-like PEP mutase family enzyme